MKKTAFLQRLLLPIILSSMSKDGLPKIQPFRGMAMYGSNPMYIPRHTKFKGYMRENRRCSFNKNR